MLSGDMQIFLVGTAHVSRNSAEEVRELIHVVKPTTIMVELCRKRADKLRSSPKVPSSPLSILYIFSFCFPCARIARSYSPLTA